MQIKPFFVFFVVLVGVIAYALWKMPEKPDQGVMTTPKEYIEKVEAAKAERLKDNKSR